MLNALIRGGGEDTQCSHKKWGIVGRCKGDAYNKQKYSGENKIYRGATTRCVITPCVVPQSLRSSITHRIMDVIFDFMSNYAKSA